jgi:hypothetical protein
VRTLFLSDIHLGTDVAEIVGGRIARLWVLLDPAAA